MDETPTRFIYAYIGSKGKVLRNEIFKNLVKNFNYNQYDKELVTSDFEKNNARKLTAKTAVNDSPKLVSRLLEQRPQNSAEDENEEAKSSTIKGVNQAFFDANELLKSTINDEKKVVSLSSYKTKDKDLQIAKKPLAPKAVRATEINKELKSASLPIITESNTTHQIETKSLSLDLKNLNKSPQKPNESPLANVVPKKTTNIQTVSRLPTESTLIQSNAIKTNDEYKNYLKWRVGAKVGIGNIRDNSFAASNALGLYQEKLQKGYTFGADIAYFPMESFGLGLVYTDFVSSNSDSDINYINQMTETEASGSISNKISRKFVGSTMYLRKSIDYKTFIVLGLSPGMYFYSDKGAYDRTNFDYRGKQFGGAARLGLDFLIGNDIIGRDIILSLEAGYNNGKLSEIDFGDGSGNILLDKPYNMDRLDFSIGLRFMRFPKYLKSR